MKQAHVYISGFVQGVGFRHFVRNKAVELGLTGWVRNAVDNRVEAVFAGSESKIEGVVALCKKGPFLSEVEDVQIEWEEGKEEYGSFEIV
ncbi:MAG: acylphosphatase [Candidatus Levybacteria bacterium]|nr:acylphosphatase [Candidatus Levybacteria bacterium]